MVSLTKKSIKEDLNLQNSSSSLWELANNKPEIRQIYGHFLPPVHRKFVRGLVAKDFNFPPASHDTSGLCNSDELFESGDRISSNTIVLLNDSIKIRPEKDGAIVYTPYFNGFYMNETAYQIIRFCVRKTIVDDIVSQSSLDLETVSKFLARALILGIVNVCDA
jgi:hypothetical protein